MYKKHTFRDDFPCGPCNWEDCECDCGWIYNADEVIESSCKDDCDICEYCGPQKCPRCGEHLHCGGCV